MRRPRLSPAIVAAALLCSQAMAGERAVSDAFEEQAVRGKLLFRIHCQSCHGETARGTGPLAKELMVRPADLTRIARRDGGDFPGEKIHRAIDGRSAVRADGMKEMPVWGLTFQQSGRDATQETGVDAQIDDLVAYLETLQRPKDR